MVTLQKYGNMMNENASEIVGLSSDTKPTHFISGVNICNGSQYFEMDTGNAYMYDEENHIWYAV